MALSCLVLSRPRSDWSAGLGPGVVESDDCRGDRCGWVGVKRAGWRAGGLSGSLGRMGWVGLGCMACVALPERGMTSRGGRCRDGTGGRATMPGSGSRIVTVGNRAALLQYQTSAEDGVLPPGPLQLRASFLGRRRAGGPDHQPLDGLPAASHRPVAGSSPKLGVRCHGRREVPCLVPRPRYLQCGPPEEAIIDGDWAILEIVGCPSFRDHTPCPKRQQHTSDPFVLGAGCRM